MSWDKLNKDVIQMILLKVDEKGFRNLFLLNKKTYKSYDDLMFMNRIMIIHSSYRDKPAEISWKNWYIKSICHDIKVLKSKYKYDYDGENLYIIHQILTDRVLSERNQIGQASSMGLVGLAQFLVNSLPMDNYRQSAIDLMLVTGVKYNNMKIINIALDNGANDYLGFSNALYHNNEELIQFFVKDGTFTIEDGLECSLQNRNKKWIEYFLGFGLHHYNKSNKLWRAALRTGDDTLIEYFMPETPDYTEIYDAACGGNIKWILEFINRGNNPTKVFSCVNDLKILPEMERITGFIPDWNTVLRDAASRGKVEICKYAIEKGADDYTEATNLALDKRHWEVVEYIKSLYKMMDLDYILRSIFDYQYHFHKSDYNDFCNYCVYMDHFNRIYRKYNINKS